MSIALTKKLALVFSLLASVAARAFDDVHAPPVEEAFCYVDNSQMNCADAVAITWAEGKIDPIHGPVLNCGGCSDPSPDDSSPPLCDNRFKMLPFADIDILIRFTRTGVDDSNGTTQGKKSFTELNDVDCGTLNSCKKDCTLVVIGGNSTYACAMTTTSTWLHIKERIASGKACTAKFYTSGPQ